MKTIRIIGLGLFLFSVTCFSSLIFIGEFKVTPEVLEKALNSNEKENLLHQYTQEVVGKTYASSFALTSDLIEIYTIKNEALKKNEEWDNVMWDKPHPFAYKIVRASSVGIIASNIGLFLFLTFGLGILGSLLFVLSNFKLLGVQGIKNNGTFTSSATNRGWIGAVVFLWLVIFYLCLYFTPDYIVNWVIIVNPISKLLNGGEASQWFLYGLLYCTVMVVMGIRMLIKYRHSAYQIARTLSVVFFQIVFAFLIPEMMARFNKPTMDLKNAWPLDYTYFFDWRVETYLNDGTFGTFLFFWGIIMFIVVVPVMVYFYGKRWYCSWVCGCGGLAETLGDPYRQLSNKKIWTWKLERYLVHSVMVFAGIMTMAVAYHSFTKLAPEHLSINIQEQSSVLGISIFDLRSWYGLLIGSIFSGIIGTGFYPIFGNRTWCRFGCPLAAYMGLIQRFKSRFRITVNGGQCISCGNCSTYCEQGIDVRSYAQKGQNIVRASCVGCGVCSEVCPRGVLKLENGPLEGRIKSNPILLGANIPFIVKPE